MTSNPCVYAQEYPGGVVAVDSGFTRERMAACYLLEGAGAVAIIETGTNHSVPRLLSVLEQRGWAPGQVTAVVVTHVHLDHAGGAGQLMARLPGAQLLVHPRGVRHMADPGKLEASVRQVYGDEVFERDYGTLVAVDAQRIVAMQDGDRYTVGGRELLFRDTPGHARHHFCVWDEATRGWFTGDTFGLSYRELDTANGPFIFPTTTPIQFDPQALRASIDLLIGMQPHWMYLTHFGRVGQPGQLAQQLRQGLDNLLEIAERHATAAGRHEAIASDMLQWLSDAARGHGVLLGDAALQALLWPDVQLNTQGIEFWLDHRPG